MESIAAATSASICLLSRLFHRASSLLAVSSPPHVSTTPSLHRRFPPPLSPPSSLSPFSSTIASSSVRRLHHHPRYRHHPAPHSHRLHRQLHERRTVEVTEEDRQVPPDQRVSGTLTCTVEFPFPFFFSSSPPSSPFFLFLPPCSLFLSLGWLRFGFFFTICVRVLFVCLLSSITIAVLPLPSFRPLSVLKQKEREEERQKRRGGGGEKRREVSERGL